MIRRSIAHISTWLLAAFFAWTTVVLAAGPLRALRLASPFWVYWPMTMLMTSGLWLVGLPAASLVFICVAIVVGLFTEIEGWGGSRGIAGLGSIVALVAVVGLGFGSWCRDQKVSPVATLQKWIEPGIQKLRELNPTLEASMDIRTEAIVANVPSAIIIVGLFSIALALLSERNWLRMISPESLGKLVGRARWIEFRVWDELIFVLMAALLATFTNHGMKTVSVVGTNVLNVLIVLYFFQGMAVVYKALGFFRVGAVWKLVIGFLLTFQLALIVACVGVADYWLEFRTRLNRRPMQPSAESK
ncbi:MAG: DUF2232 domain-containing protein [Bdellovibrionaceae bacterium]|nr:DUF2232 domain-containing protein [Pseudobdellovibrionaceae bacterium]